ncbi:hypothetical protein ACFXJ8_43605 [Nonomuraea sp. NPDC059194]|uniref:hypothetical protein n=1 Tax=Nonomuraea sp. NPDC059194 TaxID=3346764 RepID=UPI003687CA05
MLIAARDPLMKTPGNEIPLSALFTKKAARYSPFTRNRFSSPDVGWSAARADAFSRGETK